MLNSVDTEAIFDILETTKAISTKDKKDSISVEDNHPLITNARLATAFIEAFCAVGQEGLQIKSWQEYV